jgi:beta-glucuronidase
MGKSIVIIFLFIYCSSSLFSQEQLLINAYNRPATSLNGYWKYIVDPYENGFYNYRYEPFENQTNPQRSAFFKNAKRQNKADLIEYDFDKMDSLLVPGDWNTQKEKLFYYEGTVWYKKSFEYKKSENDNRVFLHIGAANYESDVYLNGKKLGKHIGGFTPFQFEVTQHLTETENHLVIKVDNKRVKEGVPTLNTDWWNYGGITRDVKLIETSETFISDYKIQLSKTEKNCIKGTIQLTGNNKANQNILLSIAMLGISKSF